MTQVPAFRRPGEPSGFDPPEPVDIVGDWRLNGDLVSELDALPADLIVATIRALQTAAAALSDDALSDPMSVFSHAGEVELAGRWDVLQNEAETRLDHGDVGLARALIDRTWDPAWRVAMRHWAQVNEVLFTDDRGWATAAEAAAALSCSDYLAALAESGAEADSAVTAGLLPCSRQLASEHPELARLVMRLWRVTSPHSPKFVGEFRHGDQLEGIGENEQAPTHTYSTTTSTTAPSRGNSAPTPQGSAQATGQKLEQGVFDVLEQMFVLDEDTTGQSKLELRRQFSGNQFGTDVIIRTRAVGTNSTCLVECKNYRDPIKLKHIAEKLVQAEEFFGAEPVDYWVLISPHTDPSNELDLLVQRWNAERKYPFQIQIWSPQSGVRGLLALSPAAFQKVYGPDAAVPNVVAHEVIESFASRLRPWLRVPPGVSEYLASSTAFMQPNEREWLPLLETQIERRGLDADGRRLDVPLQEAVLRSLDSLQIGPTALLTADFGEGKSFFTVALCAALRTRFLANPSPTIPIAFRFYLRDFRKISSASEFLQRQLDRIGVTRAEWSIVVQQWNVLVVLDGMDEMSVPQDISTTRINFEKVSDLLEELAGIPVLVTSRPNFFGSERDRERFYDRLRRPVVFQLMQPDRVETVAHLRKYAEAHDLGSKLDRIKELYDPIGLAGKVLFLEMIKATLPDLPEDRFDERILYETYVDKSFRRKVELLRDPDSALTDAELFDQLVRLLEQVAAAIHSGGEGTVDLRKFLNEAGGAATVLWKAAEAPDDGSVTREEDAAARVGGRSLLRRLRGPEEDNEGTWLVDFFHRSMKEYFVARAIVRALGTDDPFAATRALLKEISIQPEIVAFFRLMSDELTDPAQVLSSIAHSARVDAGTGPLGGAAVSLYNAVQGDFTTQAWSDLNLDGALLLRANLAKVDLSRSTLRGASLASADLTGADLRGCDLTDANLGTGDVIVDLYSTAAPGTYIGLTSGSALTRIKVDHEQSMSVHDVMESVALRWPRRLLGLTEDVLVAVGDAQASVVRLGARTGELVAHFRVANSVRSVDMVGETLLGLLLADEYGGARAVLVDLIDGGVQWLRDVPPDTADCRWTSDAVITRSSDGLVCRPFDEKSSILVSNPQVTCHRLGASPEEGVCTALDVLYGTSGGWVGSWKLQEPKRSDDPPSGHSSPVTALAWRGQTVLSTSTDGAIALWDILESGLRRAGVAERRLRCEGAWVANLAGEREKQLFVANGAMP